MFKNVISLLIFSKNSMKIAFLRVLCGKNTNLFGLWVLYEKKKEKLFGLYFFMQVQNISQFSRVCLHYDVIVPGGTNIFGRTGMCRSNGSLFYKKSWNMGPVFYQKILKHRSTFLTEPKFFGFRMVKTLKIATFLKNGPIFQEKSLKMGTLFCQNHP